MRKGLSRTTPFPDVIMMGVATFAAALAQDGHGDTPPDFQPDPHRPGEWKFHITPIYIDCQRKGWAFARYKHIPYPPDDQTGATACDFKLHRATGWTVTFESEPQ
jgi:hypothetical protein